MTRRPSATQDETTPILSYHHDTDGEGRWSLARRRSSAFLSFLPEPEDKHSDEYREYRRRLNVCLIVGLNIASNIDIGIHGSFATELFQTLVCAEYYDPSTSPGSPYSTIPSAGDPSDLYSVPRVGKRLNQMTTYTDVLSGSPAA